MTTSEATNCSWDPTEALLECTLSSESAALSLTKHQTEATRTLKLICSDSVESGPVNLKQIRQRLEGDKSYTIDF